MSKTIYRYMVPIDDRPHILRLTGDPVSVAVEQTHGYMEFWAEHHEAVGVTDRAFQVFGTGHRVPDEAEYVGTAPRTRLGLVFHLYELEA